MFSLTVISAIIFLSFGTIAFIVISTTNRLKEKFKSDLAEEADMNLADMFMFVDGQQLAKYYFISLAVVPVVVAIIMQDWISFIVALVFMAIIPKIFYSRVRNSRLKKFEGQLADAFLGLSSSLQAGTSLMGALESLVIEQPPPLSQEFSLMVRKVKLGVNLDDALVEMEERLDSLDFKVALSAIRISREVGGNLTEVMDNLSDTLRQKSAMEGKIESLTAQGKIQGYFMTALPLLLMAVLNVIEPEAMSQMYNTTIGYFFLAGIVVMLSMGFLLIRSITNINV